MRHGFTRPKAYELLNKNAVCKESLHLEHHQIIMTRIEGSDSSNELLSIHSKTAAYSYCTFGKSKLDRFVSMDRSPSKETA